MIIVEGPDGGGKTTLARLICRKLEMEYRRPPEALLSSTTGPSKGLHEWWREQMRRPDRSSGVYDRCFWVSEPIYSAVSRREPLVSPQDMQRGIHDLWAENPLIIFCMTSEEAMLENTFTAGRPRLADISEDRTSLKAINFLYHSFYAWAQQALFETVRLYDYAVTPEEDIVEWVQDQGLGN